MFAAVCLVTTLVLTLASQVAQKLVSIRFVAQANRSALRFYLHEPWFWFALTSLGLAMCCWIVVLDVWPVGTAYPLLSINYALMQIVAKFVFHETVSLRRWIGVLLIVAGVTLVAGVASP